MQPALIRVIDNIRKQLENTDWQGQYEDNLMWPAGTTEAQKQTYADLQKGLHGVPPEEHDRVAAEMAKLPQPSPLYTLRLTKKEISDSSIESQPEAQTRAQAKAQTIDIWETCYRVCATHESNHTEGDPIEADNSLFDEAGEIDWLILDEKAKSLVSSLFQALPD